MPEVVRSLLLKRTKARETFGSKPIMKGRPSRPDDNKAGLEKKGAVISLVVFTVVAHTNTLLISWFDCCVVFMYCAEQWLQVELIAEWPEAGYSSVPRSHESHQCRFFRVLTIIRS